MTPTFPEYILRTARKEHFCAGWHDGNRRRVCPMGPIQPGEVHVADVSDPPVGSPFGERKYHVACARTQGMLGGDATPIRDALADAETLRLNAPKSRWIHGAGMSAETPLETAARLGARATRLYVDPYLFARSAARAAFRAVPALREEGR